MHALDQDLSEDECLLAFELTDADGDGSISFEEFMGWWTDAPLIACIRATIECRGQTRAAICDFASHAPSAASRDVMLNLRMKRRLTAFP